MLNIHGIPTSSTGVDFMDSMKLLETGQHRQTLSNIEGVTVAISLITEADTPNNGFSHLIHVNDTFRFTKSLPILSLVSGRLIASGCHTESSNNGPLGIPEMVRY